VLKEGDPVTHIALVKEGEFDVVKRNLKGLDARILTFLHTGDFKKKIAK
jgi:CRP-like cAMP-binding protein